MFVWTFLITTVKQHKLKQITADVCVNVDDFQSSLHTGWLVTHNTSLWMLPTTFFLMRCQVTFANKKTYYTHHSYMDAHHYVCDGVTSDVYSDWVIYDTHHSDMDVHHDLCFGDSSGQCHKRRTYFTHHSDMDVCHYTCAEIPGTEMSTNTTQTLTQ